MRPSSNFGLSHQPAAQQLHAPAKDYDPWFWDNEETRAASQATRAAKQDVKLQIKQAEANEKNAMAAAMTAVAADLTNPDPAPPATGGDNTMLLVVGGVVLAAVGIAVTLYVIKQKKANAASETINEALASGVGLAT